MSDIALISKLNSETGVGLVKCRNALDKAKGDYTKAISVLGFMPPPVPISEWLTVTEAVEKIGCSIGTVRELCRKGKLESKKETLTEAPYVRWIIKSSAVDDYAKTYRANPPKKVKPTPKCVNSGCSRTPTVRGLCPACYQTFSAHVKNGVYTWEYLVEQGRALAAKAKGPGRYTDRIRQLEDENSTLRRENERLLRLVNSVKITGVAENTENNDETTQPGISDPVT